MAGNEVAKFNTKQYDRVWRDLKCLFWTTFVVSLLLIVATSGGMLWILIETTSVLKGSSQTASQRTEPPDLVRIDGKIAVADDAKIRTSEALALMFAQHNGIAIFLGFTCIFYGLLLTCLGITAGYDLRAEGSASDKTAVSFSIASSSPGILFLLGGLILVGLGLFKHIEYSDKTVVPYTDKTDGPSNGQPPLFGPPVNPPPFNASPSTKSSTKPPSTTNVQNKK